MEPVRTHRAKSVVEAARLHRAQVRKERELTLVEGPDLVADVRAAGARIVDIFTTTPDEDSRSIPVDQRALERLAGTKSPRGPVAVVEIPTECLDRQRNLLVSVGVSDPGNVGTMIRTAASFGWGFAYMEGSADPWSPKTIRAGAGGQFQTPVARIGLISELKEWVTAATVVRGGDTLYVVTRRPVALLIGEETHGLPDRIIAAADYKVTIATPGSTESLNAAVAAGIAVYALSKSGESPGEV
ncbi:MAG TPA: RNA methyltransferase [Acidimicrobiia bacterium]|nr:RNA methyltransferase [Acidimicrobiia bacterium]